MRRLIPLSTYPVGAIRFVPYGRCQGNAICHHNAKRYLLSRDDGTIGWHGAWDWRRNGDAANSSSGDQRLCCGTCRCAIGTGGVRWGRVLPWLS